MPLVPASEVLLGLYLGLLTGIFPGFIAFSIGFGFKYFTDVTVPGLGVVVLGGALAGVSGGLLGLVEPQMTESWTGITAVLVILMLCLWAHNQGDKLAAATPRKLTLKNIRESRVSANLADLVDSYGQLHIRPVGDVQDMEGYPPLPDDLRSQISESSWRFPGKLTLPEVERELEETLLKEHDLAEASVTIDPKGRAQIQAAPGSAGLSKRIPPGKRAVSIETLLPTGVARGDTATLKLPDGDVTGTVKSARTFSLEEDTPSPSPPPKPASAEEDGQPSRPPAKAPTTRGGHGRVTVALSLDDAQLVLQHEKAPTIIQARGGQREYEAVGLLKKHGNRFRKVTIGQGTPLDGTTLGRAKIRSSYGVSVLAIRRGSEQRIAPPGDTPLEEGDRLIAVGPPEALDAFTEAVA